MTPGARLGPWEILDPIGAGAMGSGIAQVAAQAGHSVLLFDTRFGAADEACRTISTTFDALAAKGKISPDAARGASGRIAAASVLADCVRARLVIEAIVENLEAKRALLHELEGIVTPETILASNTSSLSITALAASLQHPQRVVGMHFFNPAPVLPLVEVVSGLATDRAVAELQRAAAALDACGAWRYRQSAERELRKLGHHIHRRTRPGTTDAAGIKSLTGRELQVARLVVDRKTNPEIASELFLSQKTVETHLRNIFHKLDLTTRVALARAVERADRTGSIWPG